jgi:hypothetical protein
MIQFRTITDLEAIKAFKKYSKKRSITTPSFLKEIEWVSFEQTFVVEYVLESYVKTITIEEVTKPNDGI